MNAEQSTSPAGPERLVDIHCHVLPGVDDGAPDLETALELLRIAARSGTTDMIATPHQHPGRYPNPPEPLREAHAVLEEARAEAGERGEELPRVHLGAEVHLDHDLVSRLEGGELLRLMGTSYVLLELPDVFPVAIVEELLYSLGLARLRPILAHPERNAQLIRQPGQLRRFVELGALSQVTANSVSGRFGPECRARTIELLEQRLAHFVASDGHDLKRRTTSMAASWHVVAETFSEELARDLHGTNPRSVLEGRALDVAPPVPEEPPRADWRERLRGWLRL